VFAELLRLELADRDPDLVRVLHQRAAAWHQAAGHVEEAIHHATAASEFGEAGALIARHWLAYWRRGRQVTVTRWLEGLPAEAILAQPPVAFVAAWIGGYSGASKQETERLLVAVQDASWEGVLPEGISSLAFGAAQARAALVFDDVGGSVRAARRALELAGPQPSPYRWMAQAALGQALYLAGRPAQARPGLEELVGRVSASVQPYAVVAGLAVLSLLADDEDDDHTAASLAARAAAIVEAEGLEAEPLDGIVHLAVGRALTRQGKLTEAQERLGRALAVYRIDSMAMHRAHALLSLASVRHRQGNLPAARGLVNQARQLIEQFPDPGMLPTLLERTEQALSTAPRRRIMAATPLTERELAVLRLLPTQLSTREIGRQLYVSVNTVRSHVQAVYRKLEVATRTEAIARSRQLGLLPRTPTDP
jgi:LuxR family transcriptional regulator, maltose regulon positive regulatory protein